LTWPRPARSFVRIIDDRGAVEDDRRAPIEQLMEAGAGDDGPAKWGAVTRTGMGEAEPAVWLPASSRNGNIRDPDR